MARFFKWTVEFQIHEDWVADGFEMTDERALDMLAAQLGWADMDNELRAKVIKSPTVKTIRAIQGFEP